MSESVRALVPMILAESTVHADSRVGGYVTREDIPPSWPRLIQWRAIVALAREVADVETTGPLS